MIQTVQGPVPSERIGFCQFHEHVSLDMSAMRGDDDVRLVDSDEIAADLRVAVECGLDTVVDATTADIGRNLGVLKRVSEAVPCNVLASTGFHHSGTYPRWVRSASEDDLTTYMVEEIEDGIDGTDVRAGAIGELGTEGARFLDVERKVFIAAARAQVRTDVPIFTHTANGLLASDQADVLERGGVDPGRVVVGHLDCADDASPALSIARRGFLVGIDRCGIGWIKPDEHRVSLVLDLLDDGYEDQILLSSDMARRSRLVRNGGTGFSTVACHFLGRLAEAGVPEITYRKFVTDNPQRWLGRTAN